MTQHFHDPGEGEATGTGEEPVLKLRAGAVDWREVEGQVVALDRAGSVYLAINSSGAALWPAIVEGTTRHHLVQVLLESFDVGQAQAEADVNVFVTDLSERNLLER
jgi:hypothetical protein